MAQTKQQKQHLPKVGESYKCEQCGMQLKVEQDCNATEGQPRMECCGRPMTKV